MADEDKKKNFKKAKTSLEQLKEKKDLEHIFKYVKTYYKNQPEFFDVIKDFYQKFRKSLTSIEDLRREFDLLYDRCENKKVFKSVLKEKYYSLNQKKSTEDGFYDQDVEEHINSDERFKKELDSLCNRFANKVLIKEALKEKINSLEEHNKKTDITSNKQPSSRKIYKVSDYNPDLLPKVESYEDDEVQDFEYIHEYFEIDKNINDVSLIHNYDEAKRYCDILSDTNEIVKYLEENKSVSGYEIMLRMIYDYNQEVEDIISDIYKKINEKSIISAVTIKNSFGCFSEIILKKIVPSLYSRIIDKTEYYENYLEFLEKINSYLYSIGVYTYGKYKIGKKIDEEKTQYFSIDICPVSDKKLIGTIKEIERLPYFIKYINEKNKISHYFCKGKIMIFGQFD